MAKYLVGVREVHVSWREVEAEDPNEAVERVWEGDEVACEYSSTLDKDKWSVQTARDEEGDCTTFYYNESTGKFDRKIG